MNTTARSTWAARATRPAVVLPALAVVIVLVALLTPEQATSGGGFSSYSTAPDGGRIVYELAQRLGWNTTRRLVPLAAPADSTVVEVVVSPGDAIGAAEAHWLLEHARRGGAVIAVASRGALVDSLRLSSGDIGRLTAKNAGNDCGPRSRDPAAIFGPVPLLSALVWRRPPPSPPETLVTLDAQDNGTLPVAVGVQLGRGRLVLAMDGDFLRNEIVRVCRWEADLAVVRMLDFARGGSVHRTTLVFDEYHHGFGLHPGSARAISSYLGSTASGHLLVQALAAALVLLLALAPRPIVPRDPERIARRSPLEHADALAHAYAGVGATRTAATRLVDGLRRRTRRSVGAETDQDAFLRRIERESPQLAGDVAVLRRALVEQLPPAGLAPMGDALRRIEQTLTPTAPT